MVANIKPPSTSTLPFLMASAMYWMDWNLAADLSLSSGDGFQSVAIVPRSNWRSHTVAVPLIRNVAFPEKVNLCTYFI